MKELKAKKFFPYPSKKGFEDALNVIAEIRAENHLWEQKISFLNQRIEEFEEDEISYAFYLRLIQDLDKKILQSYLMYIDLLNEITFVTGSGKKITKEYIKLTNEIILKDKRSSDYFDRPNYPNLFEKEF